MLMMISLFAFLEHIVFWWFYCLLNWTGSWLHCFWWSCGVLVQPGLTSQRHSALISSDSEYFQVCFSAAHYLKISEQRWFSSEQRWFCSEQRWKRKYSELKISAETALIFSKTELIQSWTVLIFSETALKLETFRAKKSALNQSCFSADFLWNRADFLWNRADFLWNSAETPNFQSKKISAESEPFQRWFSLKESWYQLNPSWTALINPDFPLRKRWTSRDILFFFRKLLQESSDLIFPGNLDSIPLWQKEILFSFRRFSVRNPRS